MTSVPRPGWYPDPAGAPDTYRWWDGTGWGEDLSDTPQAPPPAAALAAESERPRRRSPLLRVVALLIVLALFAGTGLGVGLWLWQDPPSRGGTSGAGSPASTEPSASALGGGMDERTRRATIGEASMTLPGTPYRTHSDPMTLDEVFEIIFMAEATVHEDYSGRQDWSAVVALTALDPALGDVEDLRTGAAATLGQLAKRLYGSAPRISRPTVSDFSVDGQPGVRARARVGYRIAGLPSRYDTVTAVVVRLDDGRVVAAVSSVPNDAPDALDEQAREALASLTVR